MEYPYIVKPIDGGSSLATIKIASESDKITEENFTYKGPMMCEEFIPGREFTVTLINGKAIGIIELVFKKGFFEYEVKNSTEEDSFTTVVNPELPNGVKERILSICEECYKAVKANSVSRIDLKYDPERDRIVILELNTIPGMTPNSFTPQALKEFKGISFSEMIKMLIDDGIAYWNKKVIVEDDWKRQGLYK